MTDETDPCVDGSVQIPSISPNNGFLRVHNTNTQHSAEWSNLLWAKWKVNESTKLYQEIDRQVRQQSYQGICYVAQFEVINIIPTLLNV